MPSLFETLVLEHADECNFNTLSRNRHITPEFMLAHPELPWVWGELGGSLNPNITIEFAIEHPELGIEWGAYGMSMNPNVHPEDILLYPDQEWHWGSSGVSGNPNTTPEFKAKYPGFDWSELRPLTYNTSNSNIVEFDFDDPTPRPLEFKRFQYNGTFKVQDIVDHPSKGWHKWDWSILSDCDFTSE